MKCSSSHLPRHALSHANHVTLGYTFFKFAQVTMCRDRKEIYAESLVIIFVCVVKGCCSSPGLAVFVQSYPSKMMGPTCLVWGRRREGIDYWRKASFIAVVMQIRLDHAGVCTMKYNGNINQSFLGSSMPLMSMRGRFGSGRSLDPCSDRCSLG